MEEFIDTCKRHDGKDGEGGRRVKERSERVVELRPGERGRGWRLGRNRAERGIGIEGRGQVKGVVL